MEEDDFLMLSLSPPFSEDTVIDAEPISYCLPSESSSSSSSSLFTLVSENPSNPTLSLFSEILENPSDPKSTLFPQVSENPSNPTLSLFSEILDNPSDPNSSLFPQVSENPSKPTLSLFSEISSDPNLSPFPQVSENLAASKPIGNNTPPPPSTDLCLSTPDTSSTITTLQCPIGSQDSSDIASSSRELNALGNSACKRPLFQELGEERFLPLKKIKLRKESTNNPKRQEAAGEEGQWITKKLTKSDVNGASRLLLPRQEVKNYILPFMDEEEQSIISQKLCGVDVNVFDMDTQTEHNLTLKKWSTDSFLLVKAWTAEFVKRRNLKEKDVISIRWEKNNSRFCFRVQMRNQLDGL